MKTTEIMSKLATKANIIGFKLKKNSPEILIIAGVAGTVVSAVMACRATTKISTILEKTTDDVQQIHDCLEKESMKEVYSEEDGKKDLAIVYVKTGLSLAKLYAPSVLLGALSITSILASNNILRQRNVALAAAYAAVDKGFKEYRSRVVERFGDKVDHELKYNIKAKKFEEKVADESGKEKTVKKTVDIADPTLDEYTKIFDNTSRQWNTTPDYNIMFLRAQQQYANDLLRSRGHLFLNEVLDALDIKRTTAGQFVGWVYDEKKPNGDNFVDFNIQSINLQTITEDGEGYFPAFALNFNVDGPIYNLI